MTSPSSPAPEPSFRPSPPAALRFLAPLVFLLSATGLSRADSPARPYTRIISSDSGRMCFVLAPVIPAGARLATGGKGTAYAVQPDGALKKLWELSGWYSFSVFLSDDGRHLVRMGDWPVGKELSDDHLAVAFYDQDKLLKKYSTRDLVKDPSKVQRTVSHYFWLGNHPSYPRLGSDNEFQLQTIDGWHYTFDATTGKMTHSSPVPAGK